MVTRSVKFRSLLGALLLPLVGFIPFLVFLRRDFAAFQLLDPQAAAEHQPVPWTWERAIAALVAVMCVAAGLIQLGCRSFATSGPLASVTSWQRLFILLVCMGLLVLLVYVLSPRGYFIW
jgi:hypothetical protein